MNYDIKINSHSHNIQGPCSKYILDLNKSPFPKPHILKSLQKTSLLMSNYIPYIVVGVRFPLSSHNILKRAVVSFPPNQPQKYANWFQTSKKYFPNQFLKPDNKDATFSCTTHWIPNIKKISLNKVWAYSQSSKRWSTIISPQHRHLQP